MEKMNLKKFINDERGEFGIKQIAATVAIIVVIGFVVTAVQNNMGAWVKEIWELFLKQINGLIS